MIALLAVSAFATAASADNTVTYTATQTIPVPPASNYAGTGGGDGWNVALTPTAVYNVFHHSTQLTVACHLQANALPCWKNSDGTANTVATRTITQTVGDVVSNFATSGHSGLWVDQATAQLFIFATRTSDSAGGVVCIDTKAAETSSDALCAGHGFTPLAPAGKSRWNSSFPTGSFISNFATVGSRVFAFNFVSGTGVGDAENRLLCFDMNTFSACAGQPFALNVGIGSVSAVNYPPPAVAAIGSDVIVPINVGENDKLACFDASTNNPGGDCGVGWPVPLVTPDRSIIRYVSGNGAPFPLLTADGAVSGLCLPATARRPAAAPAPPTSGIPCFSLSGADVETPPGMDTAITPTSGWNGPAVVVGPRVYVPNGNGSTVLCYDYNLSSGCGAAFPKSFTAHSLFLLYTVNADPQRPTCIWVNADSGTQIQNFDAFTGGVCGEDGTIRVLASSSVVATPLCAPGSWRSLQVTSPARNTYASGSVAFQDASGTAIPGAGDVQLDATGTASLSALDHAKGNGLPQFLIKLTEPQGAPGSVVVQLTWTGVFDPSCATKPGTSVGSPPTSNPAKADVSVSLTAPTLSRTGSPLTFRALVSNSGPDPSTGVVVKTPVPANAKLVSASSTVGDGCTLGATATCFIGTLASGASATVTMVFTTGQAGPLTIKSSAEADFDTKFSNNSATVTATVVSPTAPPPPPAPPTRPGTFNAVGSGTIKVNGVDRPADQLFVINSGDLVDVTNGVLTFTGSDGSYISVSSSQFVASRRTSGRAAATDNLPAQFKVEQPATTGEVTTLTLAGGDFTTCNTPRALSADSKKPVRQLWGSAKGKFRTVGRYSAATVRGTIWLTQDRCDGTYTQVVESIVDVLDLSLQKTIAVNPGETYLAQPKRAALKPPTSKGSVQTAAQVRKNGLVWSGRRFATRKAFEAWLTARGGTWKHFQSTYPALAAALASRRG